MDKKRYTIIILLFLFLLTNIFIISAIVSHNADEILVKVDGVDRTVEYAVVNNLFRGTHTYVSPSSTPDPSHIVDEVWISTDTGEMTLLNALTSGISLKRTSFSSYTSTNLPSIYHLATEIILSSGKSFQQVINEGTLSCVPNLGASCGGNSCINAGTIQCDGSCTGTSNKPWGTSCGTDKSCSVGICQGWSGTGCGSCPIGVSGTNTKYCSTTLISTPENPVPGYQGVSSSSSYEWSNNIFQYPPYWTICQTRVCKVRFGWCWEWGTSDWSWKIKP